MLDCKHEKVGILNGSDGELPGVLRHPDLHPHMHARDDSRSSRASEWEGSQCDIDDW